MSNNSVEADSRFLATTLHEVRTPIQTIISTIELLEDTPLDKTQTEFVRQINFSANALLQLANDILDFTKIQSDQFKLEKLPYDVAELTESVVDLISIEAFNRNLEVVTDIDYNIPLSVMGDPNRVQQIILNLVKNAVKFTEKGFILIRLSQVKGYLLFEIADSGIGIPEEKRNLIFKDFYQVDSSVAKKYGGTGLGLSICKNLVTVMKGKIGVLQNPCGGSNFWFTLPLEIANIESNKNTLLNIPKNKKILLVDDNILALNTLKKKLLSLGIENFQTSNSSDEALKIIKAAKAKNEEFSIALIDMTLPKMTGFNLAEEIRKIQNTIKIYIMTPEGQLKGKKINSNSSCDGFIYKPIKRKNLIEILQESDSNTQNQISIKKIPENTFKMQDLSITVLIAEDHPVNRELLRIMLTKIGATVYLAEDGQKAVEQIKEHPEIDLIFMDIFMPIKNGVDATIELRRDGYKGIIIACTANNNSEDFKTYSKIGINDVLVKPFKKEEIKNILEKWSIVLMLPEANEIMNLVDINNQASDVWDIIDFMDTTGNDKNLSISLMEEYLKQTKDLLAKLKQALESPEKNYKDLEYYTHTLKGSSASVSAKKLAEFGKTMNDAAKQKDCITIESARVNFALDFLRLENFVNQWKDSL